VLLESFRQPVSLVHGSPSSSATGHTRETPENTQM
jgi:hypothetical protein